MILRRGACELFRKILQDRDQSLCSHLSKRLEELPCRHMKRNIHLDGLHDIAGIHALIELHDRDAGLLLSVDDDTLNRSSAAILRKERGMDIDRAIGRDIQHRLRQDAAIRDDDEEVRLQCFQCLHLRRVFEGERLVDRDVMRHRKCLHRRIIDLLPAAIDLIRLCVGCDGRIAMLHHGRKSRQTEIGRAHEYDAIVILHLLVLCAKKWLFQ